MISKDAKIPVKGTRALIFSHLLSQEASAVELKKKLGINESAVRRHLEILENEGMVSHYFERTKVGRPKKLYYVTSYGKEFLPRKTDLLLSMLSRKIVEMYGELALPKLMNSVADELVNNFLKPKANENADERLKKVVSFFDGLGFVASLSKDEKGYLIVYRNCAFRDAVPALGGKLCEMHSAIVLKTMGGGRIKWEKCIAMGDEICGQRVVLKARPPAKFD
jgi:predicted ArsR family transcriptional regulator